MGHRKSIVLIAISLLGGNAHAHDPHIKNLRDVPSDLAVPAVSDGEPSAGKRVRVRLPGYDGWDVFFVLDLPSDWQVGKRYPVLVEYPGNGGYKNALGDTCSGRVEDCKLGYGISGGKAMIGVCLPFVDPKTKSHALNWWGDADATAKYCRETVAHVVKNFGGNPDRVVLAGFSRGAIACNYIGLRDDETAKLWRAFIAHSHYDGVRRWGYADSDAVSARARLARLKGRPQWISHEQSVDDTRRYLGDIKGSFEFVAMPFPNHSDEWVLKDLPVRQRVRDWLADVLK